LQGAGFWKRLSAHNIDLLLLVGLYYLLSFFIKDNIILFFVCGLSYVIYHVLFELSEWRGSPGKKIIKICVVDHDGGRLKFFNSLTRNMAKVLSLAVFFFGFGMIDFNVRKKGLHDFIARSMVILGKTS